jgi:predicted nucleotide-binding protein
MDALDPALFIGVSSEGRQIARELQVEVNEQCEPTVWSQDVFKPSGTPLSDLLTTAHNADFAALVLTPRRFRREPG